MTRLHPKLEAARRRLLSGLSDNDPLARPFLTAAAFSMIPAGRGKGDGVPTVGVDIHWRIYWNDQWVEAVPVAELAAVIYHEIHHLLANHHARLKTLPVSLANIAADCEVNSRLLLENFPILSGAVTPDRLGLPRGLLAEEYASLLDNIMQTPAEPGNQGQGDSSGESGGTTGSPGQGQAQSSPEAQPAGGGGTGGDGDTPVPSRRASAAPSEPGGAAGQDLGPQAGSSRAQQGPANGSQASGSPGDWEFSVDEFPGLTEAEKEAIAREVARAIKEHKKTRGTVPGDWDRWAEDILRPPKVPWQRLLTASLRRVLASRRDADDITWARTSRRQGEARQGEPILPGDLSVDPNVLVIVDTSGSVSDDELGVALSEIRHILRRLDVVRVVWWDAEHQGTQRITNVRHARPKGGGGTDMAAAIKHAENSKPRPDVVVVITDGATPWPKDPPLIPVVAVLTSADAPQPPGWAKVVTME